MSAAQPNTSTAENVYTRLRIYYAHSIALYNTPQEARDFVALQALGFDVVNPNNPVSASCYEAEGMSYFKTVIRETAALAFRANADGTINAGIAQEIEWARELLRPVIELPSAINRRTLTVSQSRDYLRDEGAR